MTGNIFLDLVVLPNGFGLFGFIEPCSIGTTLIFVKVIEGRSASAKLAQVAIFALTRALLIGALGMLAVALGSVFFTLQKTVWVVLGLLYAALGLAYLTGRVGWLQRSFGPGWARWSGARGAALLGVIFGLNIPACAAPLLLALLGSSAAAGAGGRSPVQGFIALALFGLALSLPLVLAALFAPARRALDWVAALSRRLPVWTGLLLMALGAWSIYFGLFVSVDKAG